MADAPDPGRGGTALANVTIDGKDVLLRFGGFAGYELGSDHVLDIYDIEQSRGVIISMGGQTPNNIALPLHRENVHIYGTSPEMIDTAENRYKFSRLLDKIGVDQPLWKELSSFDTAHEFAEKVNYPVLVRPSYVLL